MTTFRTCMLDSLTTSLAGAPMCQDECTALLVRTTHIVEMLQARVTALQQVQPTGLFAMLQVTTLVRLVTDLVDEDDSLCVALTCRQLRDAVLSRFPPKLAPKARISTRRLASAVSISRVVWAQSMGCDLHDLVDLTARTGQVEVLEWALARGYSWPSDACVTAADEGHFDVLELARKTGGPWRGPNDRGLPDGEMVMRGLAQHGQVALLKQYIEAGCEVSGFVWESAASAGQLDVLDYLIEIQEEKGQQGNFQNHNFAFMKSTWRSEVARGGAQGGHVSVLKWLHEGGQATVGAVWGAACGGQLHILQWLEKNVDKETLLDETSSAHTACEVAAQDGHLEVLQWLIDHEAPMNEGTCARAAEGGSLAALKMLREHDCAWDHTTCEFAASEGHLDILKFAREQGCPLGERQRATVACSGAAAGLHLRTVQWILEQPGGEYSWTRPNDSFSLGADAFGEVVAALGWLGQPVS